MRRSITKVKEIRRALPPSDLNIRMARLAVLYEDVRLELYAAAEEENKTLDAAAGDVYRRLYFIRRAIATVLEIKGALQRLDQCPQFAPIKQAFDDDQKRAWRDAVDFLNDYDNDFKLIRNDVGGHFQEAASSYALNQMDSQVGVITIQEGSEHNSAGPRLKFAGQIVVVALTKHKGSKDEMQFYEDTLDLLKDALRHITTQVHVLTYHYLWPRFGG